MTANQIRCTVSSKRGLQKLRNYGICAHMGICSLPAGNKEKTGQSPFVSKSAIKTIKTTPHIWRTLLFMPKTPSFSRSFIPIIRDHPWICPMVIFKGHIWRSNTCSYNGNFNPIITDYHCNKVWFLFSHFWIYLLD